LPEFVTKLCDQRIKGAFDSLPEVHRL